MHRTPVVSDKPVTERSASADLSPVVEYKERPGRTAAGLVHWVQSLRLPVGDEGIPLLSGLDAVVFGTRSASETVLILNVKPPQYFWFMVSGAICDAILFAMDYGMHFYVHDPSACWAICFTLSVAFRHSTHRYLVFGNYVGGYWKSLLRIYGGYSVTIILSTIFNIIMTRSFSVRHYVAWIITLLWTGIVNFFILKRFWSFGGGKTAKLSPRVVESAVDDDDAVVDDNDKDVELAPHDQEDRRTR
jgi:putative flippase GtrA